MVGTGFGVEAFGGTARRAGARTNDTVSESTGIASGLGIWRARGGAAITRGDAASTDGGVAIIASGVAIIGDGAILNDGGAAVTGDGAAFTGGGVAIAGDGAAFTGSGVAIAGNGAAFTGVGATLTGDGAAVTGNGAALIGNGAGEGSARDAVGCGVGAAARGGMAVAPCGWGEGLAWLAGAAWAAETAAARGAGMAAGGAALSACGAGAAARNPAKGASAGTRGTGACGVAARGLWLVGTLVAARGADSPDALALAGAFTVAGAFAVSLDDTAVAAVAGTAIKLGAEAAAGLGVAVRFAGRPVASASAFAWTEAIARRSSASAVAVSALG